MGHNNKKKKRSFNQVLERTIRNKGMGNILSDTEISYYKHLLQTFHNGEQEEKGNFIIYLIYFFVYIILVNNTNN